MLREQPSYEEYIHFVETWLHVVYPEGPPPIHAHVATMLMLVDMTPMRKIVWHLYSVWVDQPEHLRICFDLSFAWCCVVTLPLPDGSARCEATLSMPLSLAFSPMMCLVLAPSMTS
jgi:hypothetical protein